jgi:hypothetical protein
MLVSLSSDLARPRRLLVLDDVQDVRLVVARHLRPEDGRWQRGRRGQVLHARGRVDRGDRSGGGRTCRSAEGQGPGQVVDY